MNVSLYQAASALNATDRWQEAIAENLAASSVPGYKKQDFVFTANVAGPAGPQTYHGNAVPQMMMPGGAPETNFQAGELRLTTVPTDLAIQGKGFFEVELSNGVHAYTRDGEFATDAQGQWVTKQGYLVLGDAGPIQLDRKNPAPISVSPNGQISQGATVKGKLKLMEFSEPSLLTHLGGGYFAADDPSIKATPSPKSTLRQGFLESSNTSPVREMTSLISAMRLFEANQRAVQIHDERTGRLIHDLESNS